MKKLCLSAAALVVLFAACSKDDDNTPQTPAKKYLLHMISADDSVEVTYDAAYNMKKISAYSDANSAEISELTYENGKLTKKSASYAGSEMKLIQSFDYNSAGKLLRANFYVSGVTVSRYDSLAYDANGRLTALYEFSSDIDGSYKIWNKYVYTWDSKGNITREVRVAMPAGVESKDSSITDYTYDNKVNYASRQPEFFLLEADDPTFGLSANNILKSVHTTNTNPGFVSTVTEEYTYDEDGYPVTQKETEKETQDGTVVYSSEDSYRYRYIKK
jgi:antitoxin component YwqK of YwqJK toxin-antitoxin module